MAEQGQRDCQCHEPRHRGVVADQKDRQIGKDDVLVGDERQARDELASRTLDVLYKDDGAKDKWWGSFAKRKFMQKELRA